MRKSILICCCLFLFAGLVHASDWKVRVKEEAVPDSCYYTVLSLRYRSFFIGARQFLE